MLCPAMLDPFGNEYYRLATIIHQGILCPLLAKLLCITGNFIFTKFSPTKVKTTLSETIHHDFPLSDNDKYLNGNAHVD